MLLLSYLEVEDAEIECTGRWIGESKIPELIATVVYLRVYTIGGLDYWTGLLDWTTGLPFHLAHAKL